MRLGNFGHVYAWIEGSSLQLAVQKGDDDHAQLPCRSSRADLPDLQPWVRQAFRGTKAVVAYRPWCKTVPYFAAEWPAMGNSDPKNDVQFGQ